MPTAPNRSFFANFFAAFRAQPSFTKTAPSALAASSHPSVPSSSNPASNNPQQQQSRALATKSTQSSHHSPTTSSTAAAVAAHAAAQFSSHRGRAASASPRPAGPSPLPCSPRPPSATRSPPPYASPPAATTGGFQRSRTPSETRLPRRRGSSCSSDGRTGLRDAFSAGSAAGAGKGAASQTGGGQNWYIGGRTASGEEVFYKLGVVKRYRSADKLSLDRLSL